MAKIDFKHFGMYAGVSKKVKMVSDMRESFADVIYKNVNGIKAHALALKIYQSEGETEYSEDEVRMMRGVAQMCTPAFMDSLYAVTDDGKEE